MKACTSSFRHGGRVATHTSPLLPKKLKSELRNNAYSVMILLRSGVTPRETAANDKRKQQRAFSEGGSGNGNCQFPRAYHLPVFTEGFFVFWRWR